MLSPPAPHAARARSPAGTDGLIAAKSEDLRSLLVGTMTEERIRLREEVRCPAGWAPGARRQCRGAAVGCAGAKGKARQCCDPLLAPWCTLFACPQVQEQIRALKELKEMAAAYGERESRCWGGGGAGDQRAWRLVTSAGRRPAGVAAGDDGANLAHPTPCFTQLFSLVCAGDDVSRPAQSAREAVQWCAWGGGLAAAAAAGGGGSALAPA